CVRSADELSPDTDVVRRRPPDRDAGFRHGVSRPVRCFQHGEGLPACLPRVVTEQLADTDDLDAVPRVVAIIAPAAARVAVGSGRGRSVGRSARRADLPLQRFDRSLLRIELRLELVDELLLGDELLAQRADLLRDALVLLRFGGLRELAVLFELALEIALRPLTLLEPPRELGAAALELDDAPGEQLPFTVPPGESFLGIPYDLFHAGERILVLLDALLHLRPVLFAPVDIGMKVVDFRAEPS